MVMYAVSNSGFVTGSLEEVSFQTRSSLGDDYFRLVVFTSTLAALTLQMFFGVLRLEQRVGDTA